MTSPPERAPTREPAADLPCLGDPAGGPVAPARFAEKAEITKTTVRPRMVWAALIVLYVVWGSTYLAIRVAVETLPPLLSGGLRFGAAGLILGAVLAARRGLPALRVTWRQLGACALVGTMLLAGGNGGVVLAESGPPGRAVPTGVAALLIAAVPLIVVALRAATGDRPRLATVAGVLVGFMGLAVLVLSRGGTGAVPLAGALLVVGAAVSWALGSFLSRGLPLPPDPFVASVYEMLTGAVALAVLALVRGERLAPAEVSTASWVALGYLLGAGSLLAFTAYVWLLQTAPISLVATYAYVNPAVAVLLGALLLAEPITAPIVAGGAVIVAGVALVVSNERPTARSEEA
jgi:drug/metabolite transporter (DMT)-like permease